MGEAPRQLAPRRHSFGLDQAFALIGQLMDHRVERVRQRTEFACRLHVAHTDGPVAVRHRVGRVRKLLDRTRHTGRQGVTQREPDGHAECADAEPRPPNLAHERSQLSRACRRKWWKPSAGIRRPASRAEDREAATTGLGLYRADEVMHACTLAS